jgi:hypothetical protein
VNYTKLHIPTSKLSSHCWLINILDINPRHEDEKFLGNAMYFIFVKHLFSPKSVFIILRIVLDGVHLTIFENIPAKIFLNLLYDNSFYYYSKDISNFILLIEQSNLLDFKQKINYNRRNVYYNPGKFINCNYKKISKCSAHYHSVLLLSEIANFTIILGATIPPYIVPDIRDVYILDGIFFCLTSLKI